MTISGLLDRLDGLQRTRRGWRARCPAHADHRPSLDLATGGEGRLLVVCRAGCRTREILRALGATWSDLFPSTTNRPRPTRRRAPDRFSSPLEGARAQVFAEAQRQPWARPGVLGAYHRADLLRCLDRLAEGSRRVASALGPTDEAVWDLLAAAAGLERIRWLEESVA